MQMELCQMNILMQGVRTAHSIARRFHFQADLLRHA